MGIDHIFNNLCAKTCSTGFSAHHVIGKKAVEDIRRHAPSCVFNGEDDFFCIWRERSRYRDGTPGGNFRDGIVNQIVHCIKEALLIGLENRQPIQPTGL